MAAIHLDVQWCIESVDQCWSQKERFIKAEEMEQAKLDYAHARKVYRYVHCLHTAYKSPAIGLLVIISQQFIPTSI